MAEEVTMPWSQLADLCTENGLLGLRLYAVSSKPTNGLRPCRLVRLAFAPIIDLRELVGRHANEHTLLPTTGRRSPSLFWDIPY